jgi:hypothetical protein
MIPLSGNQLIDHVVDGVTYQFYPPVGDKEGEIIAAIDGMSSKAGAATFIDKAVQDVTRRNKGKRLKKGELDAQIQERAIELSQAARPGMREGIDQINELIDLVLAGWKTARAGAAPFPKDAKPSTKLSIGVKRELVDWYTDQALIGETEAKNS